MRASTSSSVSGFPASWKARELGARQVTLGELSRVSQSSVRLRARSRAERVSGRPRIVLLHVRGGLRTLFWRVWKEKSSAN